MSDKRETFINDRGLNYFYQGIKQRFLRKDGDADSNTFIKSCIVDYLDGNNFTVSGGRTNLEGYIKYLITDMMSSAIIGDILDSKYDDVKVYDFVSLLSACEYYIEYLTQKRDSATNETIINKYSSYIQNLTDMIPSYSNITSKNDYTSKYQQLSQLLKEYVNELSNTTGFAFTVFPYQGAEDVLYVDTKNDIQYIWNNETSEYEPNNTPIDLTTIEELF